MVDKTETKVPIENLWQERPLIEYFPQATPVVEGKGTKVDVVIGGEKYQISAHKYLDDGKWPHKYYYRMAFAVWEPNGKLVACADYKINRGSDRATCDDRSPQIPKEIQSSGNIGPTIFGFLVHESNRGKHIGDTLLATSLMVLEGIGIQRVGFVSDATRSDCADVEYWPQWFSDPKDPDFLEPTSMSSFYTKYNQKIAYREDATVVGTRLSSMQISLIESAFGKPSSEVVE